MTQAPAYLAQAQLDSSSQHGILKHVADRVSGDTWVISEAPPYVKEFAKRIFPGCSVRGQSAIQFRATRRAAGDLIWFMQRFPLKPALPSVAQELEKARQSAIDHANRRNEQQTLARIEEPIGFHGKLFDYQALGVDFLTKNERALLADDMGLGKTVTALASLAQSIAFPAVIVCPATVQRQWLTMADRFLRVESDDELLPPGPPRCVQLRGLVPNTEETGTIYVLHYGILRAWDRWLSERNIRAVIFDEIQELRNVGTAKYSAASKLADSCDLVWGLSGTPIYNYGNEIWSILNIIDFNCLGDYEGFTREWCTGYLSRTVAKPEVLGNHMRSEGLMLRRRKDDVQGELPKKRRVTVPIEHDESVFWQLVANASAIAAGYDQLTDWKQRGQAGHQIEQETRRATGVSKAHYVVDFVTSLFEAGERIVIFAYHHEVHEKLVDQLTARRMRCVKVTGRETPTEKEYSVREFAGGRADVAILSLRTAAGLDGLQEAGTCVVFAELDWSPAIHAQCEDRLHRIGFEKESLLIYYLVSEAGTDAVMQDALGLKVGQFTELMGDATETDDEKQLAGRAAERHLEKILTQLKQGKEK